MALLVWAINAIHEGARQYLVERDYVLDRFEVKAFCILCYANKDRHEYHFSGTLRGKPVKGYLCYGGINEAVIHHT